MRSIWAKRHCNSHSERRYLLVDNHGTGVMLDTGIFITRALKKWAYTSGRRHAVYLCGAGPDGCAGLKGTADRLVEAKQKALDLYRQHYPGPVEPTAVV